MAFGRHTLACGFLITGDRSRELKMSQKTVTPAVSVVIPLYNKGSHISRALDSVLGQGFPYFEIVVVNDASTDDGPEVVKQYTDPRIRLVHRDSPQPGGEAARNEGIANSSAPLIAFLDA